MKKKIKKIGVSVLGILFLSLSFFIWHLWANKYHFLGGELMSQKEVCKRWGKEPFSAEKFKANKEASARAKMACSLLKNQKMYIGIDSGEIRNILGDYSGYYFNEAFPTYFIQRAKKIGDDSCQLVFLIDRQERIAKIVVHKNCCH